MNEAPTADDSAELAYDDPTLEGGGPIERVEQIGRFEILGLLGAGGMGVVYTAYDPALDRKVAVKVLRERSTEREDRAWREARALARLAHPNVVAIHEVGRHAGRVFLAMELVEGVTLDLWLARQRRDPPAILDVAFQAGRGLAAAHAEGIVHRDFKPSNVIVGFDGRTRVVDFGLARSFAGGRQPDRPRGAAPVLDTILTRAGGRPGTPRYMSPEQREGLPVDARSDQYAFCVVLFEALAGEVPGATRAHPVFSRRSLRRLRPILVRGLALRPEDRHPTMAALCERLAAAMRPRGRVRATLGLGAVTAMAAGFMTLRPAAERCDGAARALPVWNEARAARFTAAITHADADASATLSAAIDRVVADWTTTYASVCAASGRGERSPELRDLQMACLDQHLGDLGGVLSALETQAASAGEVAAALARLTPVAGCAETQALYRRAAPPLERVHPDEASLRQRLAEATAQRLLGRADVAGSVALEVADTAEARALWTLAGEARLLAGQALLDKGRPTARARLVEALLHARAHGLEDVAMLAAAALVRWSAVRAFDLEDARLFAGLARAGLDLTGDGGLLRAEVLQSIARVHWLRGDVERMLPMLEEAREILTTQLGARRPEVASALLELAAALGRLGRADEALARLLAARSIYEEHYGPLHPVLTRLYFNLAAAYADLGRLDEGFAASARAVELLSAGGAPPEDIAAARLNLVDLLLRAGRAADALPVAREVEAVLARVYGPSSLAVSNARLALGEALHDLGRTSEAVPAYHDAWTIQRAQLGDASPETSAARVRYAHALVSRDPAAALALLPDVDALPDELRGLALLTRAQARVASGTELASAHAEALRARASLADRTARDALLRRELEDLVALTQPASAGAPPPGRGASATSARGPAPR